jgi:hypothetical protein
MMMAQEHIKQDQKYKLRRVHQVTSVTLSSAHRYQAIPMQAAAVIAVASGVMSAVGTASWTTAVADMLISVVVLVDNLQGLYTLNFAKQLCSMP